MLIAMIFARRTARAQVELSGDAGVSHLKQTGIPEGNAFVLGATLDVSSELAFFRATALGADGGSAGSTGQGVALLAIADPSLRFLRWEVDGAASAFGETGALPTSSGEATGRLRLGDDLRGASLGAAVGATRHIDQTSALSRALAGGWWTAGAERFAIDVTATRTSFPVEGGGASFAISKDVAYTDAAFSWRHQASGIALGATAGARGLTSGPVSSGTWFAADATLWLAPNAGIVLAAGRTLEDVVRGVPRASYASVSLHLSSRPHATIVERQAAHSPRIVVQRMNADSAAVEIVAPNASSVELIADFTDWAPVALARAGAVWRVERAISPGAHRLAIRIDGGAWTVPPNLPSVSDELGGTVGVITVP